jgi:hypothetical protein
MDERQLSGEINRLRARFEADSLLNLEFLAGLARLLRRYNIEVSGELLRDVVIALPSELVGTADIGRGADSTGGGPPQPGTGGGPPQPGTGGGPPQPGKPKKPRGGPPQPGKPKPKGGPPQPGPKKSKNKAR